MKKILSLLTLLVLVTLVLTACSSDKGATTPANASVNNKDVVEIDFFHRWPNEPRKIIL